jgi:hypothetical protein
MSVTQTIDTDDRVVDIDITGADQLFGFRRRIELPVARINGAHAETGKDARSDLKLRLSGVRLPGTATAMGYFRGRRAARQWWCVHHGGKVLVIDLDADAAFDRIVLEVPDAEAAAARITSAIAEPPQA